MESLKSLIESQIPSYSEYKITGDALTSTPNPFTVFSGNGETATAIINTNGDKNEEIQEMPTGRIKSTSAVLLDGNGNVKEYKGQISIEDKIQNLDRLSDLLGRKIEQMLKFKNSEGLSVYSTDVLMRYITIFMQMLVNREYMKPLENTNILDQQNTRPTDLKPKEPETLIDCNEYPAGTIICNPEDLLNPESDYNIFKQQLINDFLESGGVLIQCSASNINDTGRNKVSAQIGKNAAENNNIFVSGGSGKNGSAMDLSSVAYLNHGGKKWIAVLTPEIYDSEKIAMEKLAQYKDQIQIIMTPDWDTRIRVMRNIANFNNNAEIEISHGGLGTVQEFIKLTQLNLEDIRDGKSPIQTNISDYEFYRYFIETTFHMIDIAPTIEHNEANYKIMTFKKVQTP